MKKTILLFSTLIALNAQARNDVDSLLAISSSVDKPDSTRLMALYIVAWDIYLYNQPDSAYYYGVQYLNLAKELKSMTNMANAYNTIGASFYQKGETVSAIPYYEKSLLLHELTKNKNGIAGLSNNIGLIYKEQGNYPKALAYLSKSLTIKESLGNNEKTATTLVNIGNIYLYQENFIKALDYYTKALDYQKNTSDLKAKANTINNIGLVHKNLGDFGTSMNYYERSLALYKQIKDRGGMISSYNNIGNLHRILGSHQEAIHFYQLALKLSQEIGDRIKISNSYINLGAVYGKIGQYNLALENGYLSLKIAEEIGNIRFIRDASLVLYENEKKVGNFEKSLNHYEYYVKMQDSIQGEESKTEVLVQGFEYEFEKQVVADSIRGEEAQKANKATILAQDELLVQKNRVITILLVASVVLLILLILLIYTFTKLKRSRVQLQKSLVEKDALLREIHHRVKNNLQVVSSLLNMHVRKVKDPHSKQILEEGADRVTAMAIIHKNLYQHTDLKTISLDNYLEKLCNQLFNSYQITDTHVELKTEMNAVDVDVDQLIPIGLIVNELISNAMKHAFHDTENAQISVKLSSTANNRIELEISDNGVGIMDDMDLDKSESIGMKLIRIFSEKLNSLIEITNKNGTCVTLSIPNI